ncbi:MAG TPA: NAD(P)/FAD-dependent oxidoreductase [Acidimicrobiales bacterium]|nr:NAD(P)/FAD-dependent oxidoreductase [Acidimicrobiales bacterium]
MRAGREGVDHEAADHEVVVIGAGLGGIGMGIALARAGIDQFVILERADDIGGTWRDNTYPGVAVDIPAQAYQFSYRLNPDWRRTFARGWEVKAYIDRLADRYRVRPHVRLGAGVTERVWDEEAHLWRLHVGGGEVTARFVVSAVGAFVDPKPPGIPGLDAFAGKVMHSAAWDHDYDLAGRRVALVGTGASAVQLLPEIAPVVGNLDVYQRTPIWVGPKIDLATPALLRRFYRRAPGVQDLVRRAATRGMEAALVDLVVSHARMPFVAEGLAWLNRRLWYRLQVRDPGLRARLTPDYGLGCKRPSVSNTYLRTFNRANVELVTDPIEAVTADGVRTADGVERPADVLVLATGFRLASDPENFRRTPVRGRGGFDLATFYATQRLASYEGVSLPGLPNHFMIFGPYGWTGGTWHTLVETAATHIVRVIREAHRRGATAVEVTQGATDRWTEAMRRRLDTSLFHTNNCATAHSYYFDHHGDTPFLRPTSSAQAWRSAQGFPLEDYVFESPARPPTEGRRSPSREVLS